MEKFNFKIKEQGGPIVNDGYIVARGENIVAAEIDMSSKRCDILMSSNSDEDGPMVWIDGDGALHLNKGLEKQATAISFPEWVGWEIFSVDICRYTLRIVLTKNE